MRRAAYIVTLAIVGALVMVTKADVAPSRRAVCLESRCTPVVQACFEKVTSPCAAFGRCLAPCEDGDVACIESCQSSVDTACAQCMNGMLECGRKHCPEEVSP